MTDPSEVYQSLPYLKKQFPNLSRVLSVLILADLALLFTALLVPVVQFSQILGYSRVSYSILGSVKALFKNGDLFIASVILFFSAVFPALKLVAMVVLLHRRLKRERRIRIFNWLRLLAKWSMVDVFVIVVMIGTLRLGFLAHAQLQIGIYLFAGAILSSMFLILIMISLTRTHAEPPSLRGRPGLFSAFLALLGILLLLAGIFFPLMEVDKWVFWKNEYSIIVACLEMAAHGDRVLALLFFVLVVLFPLLKLLGLLILGFTARSGWRPEKIDRFIFHLDDWAMADVFILGLTVASVKISGMADIHPRIGMWCFAAAVILSVAGSWRMRWRGEE